MSKLKYGYAVVSFCPDLTSATALSIPLAGLLIGEVGDEQLAAVAHLDLPPELFKDDPFAAAVLNDLPKLLRDHVDEAFAQHRDGPLDSGILLRELQQSLRNTLHVSEISPVTERELEADAMMEVPKLLVEELTKRLTDVLRRSARDVSNRRASRPAVVTAAPRASELPEFQMWKPKRRVPLSSELHA